MSCGPTIITQKVVRPLKIARTSRGTVVTRDGAKTLKVTRPATQLKIVRDETNLVVQRPITRVLKITTPGAQGPPGAPGGSIAPIDFAWGDAAAVVFTAPEAGLLARCRVDITTPFNGAGAAIRVGTAGLPEAAMPANRNDPSAVAKYQTTPDFQMAAGDALRLVIDPGTSPSSGAGILILEFLPD